MSALSIISQNIGAAAVIEGVAIESSVIGSIACGPWLVALATHYSLPTRRCFTARIQAVIETDYTEGNMQAGDIILY
jgi:hypothetical protein